MMNRRLNAGKVSIRPQSIDELDLSSKRLLVIGGTNGLGRAIAGLALACGVDVTVVGRTLREFPQGQPKFVRADLSLMADALRLGEDLAARIAPGRLLWWTDGYARNRHFASRGRLRRVR